MKQKGLMILVLGMGLLSLPVWITMDVRFLSLPLIGILFAPIAARYDSKRM